MAWLAIVISLLSLSLSGVTALSAVRQRRRAVNAAVTTDLYPILRALRDSAWQFAKPLGGQQPDQAVSVHTSLIDLNDLTPAIADDTLKAQCEALLREEAAGYALAIDPPRFHGMHLVDSAVDSFQQLGDRSHDAVERCQGLRRGTT